MTTLRDVASLLGISRTTLEKWCRRLGITPVRHPSDYRFYTLTEEEVQRIRDARSAMPAVSSGSSHPPRQHDRLSYNKLAFDRSLWRNSVGSEVSPDVTPTSQNRPLQREHVNGGVEMIAVLPPGMMSRTEAADRHGIPRSNLRRWVEQGVIAVSSETYAGAHGQFAISQPLTAHGLAQLYALAHRKPYFLPCPECPHSEGEKP